MLSLSLILAFQLFPPLSSEYSVVHKNHFFAPPFSALALHHTLFRDMWALVNYRNRQTCIYCARSAVWYFLSKIKLFVCGREKWLFIKQGKFLFLGENVDVRYNLPVHFCIPFFFILFSLLSCPRFFFSAVLFAGYFLKMTLDKLRLENFPGKYFLLRKSFAVVLFARLLLLCLTYQVGHYSSALNGNPRSYP